MKRNNIILTSLFLVLIMGLIISCAPSMKVSSDYEKTTNFSKYQSFSVYGLVTTLNVNSFNAERIINAIRYEMIKKGYTENNNYPDLVVNAVTILKEKQSVSATGHGGWYRPYTNVSFQTNHFKEGTLVIDVIDPGTNTLIWEGATSSEINGKPKDPERVINKTVAKILNEFPAASGSH
jgi:hypothetical protein